MRHHVGFVEIQSGLESGKRIPQKKLSAWSAAIRESTSMLTVKLVMCLMAAVSLRCHPADIVEWNGDG